MRESARTAGTWSGTWRGALRLRDVALSGTTAYLAANEGGRAAVDVGAPGTPVQLGAVTSFNSAHDSRSRALGRRLTRPAGNRQFARKDKASLRPEALPRQVRNVRPGTAPALADSLNQLLVTG